VSIVPHSDADEKPRHIPIIGRLTMWELIGFICLPIIAAFGVLTVIVLWPFLDEIHQPGSGGGAQMILAMFVYPWLFFGATGAFGALIGLMVLVVSVRKRLRKRAATTHAT
jgi:uncharacterized RDD family membrane protein YckC